jgi:hypothetical protein
MDLVAEAIESMVAFALASGADIVKAYGWYQVVLYGRYMKRAD